MRGKNAEVIMQLVHLKRMKMNGIVIYAAHLSPVIDHVVRTRAETLSVYFPTVINLLVEQTQKDLNPNGLEVRSSSHKHNKACGNAS